MRRNAGILLALAGVAMAFGAEAAEGERPDYREAFKELAARGASETGKFWREPEGYFAPKPFPAEGFPTEKLDIAAIYWNALHAQLGGDAAAARRALSFYDFLVKRLWNEETRRFRTSYDYMENATLFVNLGFALRHARDQFPEPVQNDIRERMRQVARFLPTYESSLTKKDGDLRACNQDALAALALALMGSELADPAVTASALVKFRLVLAHTQQSFWVEGGVDVGYQSVGEPLFMAAANLLWPHLERGEKLQLAAMLLNGPVGNGYGIENGRSPGWMQRSRASTVASGILGRVANPFVAADAERLFLNSAQKGFSSRWWLTDTSALAFFAGLYDSLDAASAAPKRTDRFAAGSLATHIMIRDEFAGWYGGMEKGYLTGHAGATAIFGDYTRIGPRYRQNIFKIDVAAAATETHNPGGLRYLGYNSHLYLIPDGALHGPGLVPDDLTRRPQMMARTMHDGAGAGEYVLVQTLPGAGVARPPVRQVFVVAGDVLLAFFQSGAGGFSGLSYGLSLPAADFKALPAGGGAVVRQKAIGGGDDRTLVIHAHGYGDLRLDAPTWPAYFRAEFAADGNPKATMPNLRRVLAPFAGDGPAALVLSPENRAQKVAFAADATGLTVTFESGGLSWWAFLPVSGFDAPPPPRLEKTLPDGRKLVVAGATADFVQLFAFAPDGRLRAFTARAAGVELDGRSLFSAARAATVSGLTFPDGATLLTADDAVGLSAFWGGAARSLVDDAEKRLPGTLGPDRLLTTP